MIIQFLHPGKQYKIIYGHRSKAYRFFDGDQHSGVLYWSSFKSHSRRYIRTTGDLIVEPDHKMRTNCDIVFWGEWEAHSLFTLVQSQNAQLEHPQHVHRPFFSTEHKGSQNTDPFVFGDCFVYSNCLQKFPRMRNLPNGSLILFGSEITDAFALDTVFVVQSSLPLNRTYLQNIQNRTSEIFRETVLRKIDLNDQHKVYFSASYTTNTQEYYSYFPCRLFDAANPMLRPVLPYKQFDLKKPGSYQGIHIIEQGCLQYWHRLTQHLVSNGYSLGVRADLPPCVDIKDAHEYFA